MDTVLGVSMAPTAVRMVLVEGVNGDGATVDQEKFDIPTDDEASTVSAADQIVSAILGTRESAAEGGYQLASTGVTFTDPIEAAALRDALRLHLKILHAPQSFHAADDSVAFFRHDQHAHRRGHSS